MKKIIALPIFLFFLSSTIFSQSQNQIDFNYKFSTGDRYRILSTIDADMFFDRVLSYRAETVNRISVEVIDTRGDSALHSATLQNAQRTYPVQESRVGIQSRPFEWDRDYFTEYWQDRLGYMTVDDSFFIPMVRDVPVFPARSLSPGDTWSAPGLEIHDFRDMFGIEEPFRLPFIANYTYLGESEWKGKPYQAFSVSYRIFEEPEAASVDLFPTRFQVASDQIIYWDLEAGHVAAYEEYFRTIITLSDGVIWESRGRAEAEIIESLPMNRAEMLREIAEEIREIPNTSVRISDEGVVISLENIQFSADSAILMPSEMPKLELVAEILMRYPDRDILVGGHTALARTAEGRLRLSQERAQSVANYFLERNIREPGRMVVRGFGAEQPIADNSTEQGMAQNRRVEITILEN